MKTNLKFPIESDATILSVLEHVEAHHFRTANDTGANPAAMTVWNSLRSKLGLPTLSKSDLPFWNGKQYVAPQNSNLLEFKKKQSDVLELPPIVTEAIEKYIWERDEYNAGKGNDSNKEKNTELIFAALNAHFSGILSMERVAGTIYIHFDKKDDDARRSFKIAMYEEGRKETRGFTRAVPFEGF